MFIVERHSVPSHAQNEIRKKKKTNSIRGINHIDSHACLGKNGETHSTMSVWANLPS